MKKIILFFVISLTFQAFSQELYLNKEFKKGLTKETRTKTGQPGKNYWINKASYDISAKINQLDKKLAGSETIIFENASNDTLKTIVFKLFQNIYKSTTPKNIEMTSKDITAGMEISKFVYENNEVDLTNEKMYRIDGTNLYFFPQTPVPPKTKITFKIEWSFTIPSGIHLRMGAINDNTSFLGYWYPRIAVYDDVFGWDVYPYEGEHEFYNDFSDYKVSLTVPNNFGIWATGTLTNPENVLKPEILKNYKKALTSESIVSIIDSNNTKNPFIDDKPENTWVYTAEHVTDFAFGISSGYVWEGCATKTIEELSNTMPAVAYPYPQITVFHGDGGMEFPMIVNDGEFPDRITHIYVTSHEIAHMYFPFYTGTNETRHSWIDEGMAYFLPFDVQTYFDPFDHRIRAAKGFANYAGKETDVALMTPTMYIREPDLSMLTYYKPALVYEILQDMLGKETFVKCMQQFIYRWNGKHPVPYDFFFTFNDVSGKNLNWYWKPWLFERGIPDNGIKSVTINSNDIMIVVEKVGELPIPVDLTINYDDNTKENIHKTCAVWADGNSTVTIPYKVNKKVISVELGAPKYPDSNPKNNLWKND